MMEKDQKKSVTIVGAGFSGLTTAFYLMRAGFDVQILEVNSRAGGLLGTERDSHGLVESAANGLLNTVLVEDLFGAIGIELLPTLKESRKRFIYRSGRPRRWPFGALASLRILWFVLVYVFARSRLVPRKFESVRSWGQRVLGKEATEYGLEAALQGIYAGDPARMSATLLFSKFFRSERKRRPKIKGTVSAPGGMGELLRKLRETLERNGVRIQLGREVSSLSLNSPVVIATSAADASLILRPLDSERANALARIELLPLVSATVFFEEPPPPRVRGFGCLFPPREKRRALGVLMNSFIFPERVIRGVSETWIFGGASPTSAKALALNDGEVLEWIQRERAESLGAQSRILHSRLTRWSKALPHYTIELEEILPIIKRNRNNVFLIGNYLGEIGLSRILESAQKLAAEVQNEGKWEP